MYKKKLKKSAIVVGIILSVALTMSGCKSTQNSSRELYAEPAVNSYKAAGAMDYDDYGYGEALGEAYDYEYEMAPAAVEESYMDQSLNGITGTGDGDGGAIIDSGSASSSVGNNDKRKLIRTVDLQVETKEYDALRVGIEEQIKQLGGYIENEYSYNGSTISNEYDMYGSYGGSDRRYTNMTIRIPDANLDDFVTVMSGMSNVVSKTSTATDVSLQYTDLESKRDMYRAEQESLMMLLEKAETIEDITYLTSRLTDVRYNIESMERQLRLYDNQVDYATVSLRVTEVEVLTPQVIEQKTPAEEMKEGFRASVEDVLTSLRRTGMNLVINLPYIIRTLIILAIIVGVNFAIVKIIIAIVKKNIRKRAAKKAALAAQATEGKAVDAENKEVKDSEEKSEEESKEQVKEESKA